MPDWEKYCWNTKLGVRVGSREGSCFLASPWPKRQEFLSEENISSFLEEGGLVRWQEQVTGSHLPYGLWASGLTWVTVLKNTYIYIYPDKVVNGLEVPDRALQIPAVAVLESFTGSDDGSSWQSVLQLWPLLFLLFSLRADRFFPWVTIYKTRISIIMSTHFDRDVCPENTAGVFVPLQDRVFVFFFFLREKKWEAVLEKESAWAYLLCAFVIMSKNDLPVLLCQIILDLFIILK